MNIQYIRENSGVERFPKQRNVEGSYKLFAQILSGFEMAPSLPIDSLNTKVDIKIGNIAAQKGKITTNASSGRYPIWDFFDKRDIVLDKNLAFAPDMRVMLYNKS